MLSLVICGEEVACKKPAPDIYLRAADCLGLRPEECVAIEDSAMGLAAATAAGIKTVITVNENTRDEDFGRAEIVVETLGGPEEPSVIISGPVIRGNFVTLKDLQHLFDDA